MLTENQRAIVKSTVPLLETGGEALITHFYNTMLGEYPEVRPLFNQAHQQSGAQPRALAHSVLMYAKHIDRLDALGEPAAGPLTLVGHSLGALMAASASAMAPARVLRLILLAPAPGYGRSDSALRDKKLSRQFHDDMFNGFVQHAKDGVDFMTVHCGITREVVDRLKRSPRVTDVVSRGGSFLVAWILHNEKENPFYENFDYLLELAKEHEVTLSLGDGMRPGCIHDATDGAQVQELIVLGELVQRCRKAGVQCMVEGPGHVPLDQVEANVRLEKSICDGAPFYVLGPLVTDIAPGYDHITSAIGGALAAYHGADFLCYVTPAEHLSLPTPDDVKEGVIASKIAAHAADVARGRGRERDMRMAEARRELDWESMYREALDPDKAKEYRARGSTAESDGCSMCGDVCAIKLVQKYLRNE